MEGGLPKARDRQSVYFVREISYHSNNYGVMGKGRTPSEALFASRRSQIQ